MGSIGGTTNPTELLELLSLDEKVSLLAGKNLFSTASVDRLKIPSVKVSDGPNGCRSSQFFGGVSAACFPCAVSLAATWDRSRAKQVGNAIADEAKSKGVSCLLAPTVCPHRSPLGGRNFESFSEDPFLSGEIGAKYVIGLQEKGIGACLKHFAGNEQETKRYKISANISERALREIYLKPFEIIVKQADPWAIMTGYNRVNGVHCDQNSHILREILYGEWNFQGLVMSDWGGTTSVSESLEAGLHLEMPGPPLRRNLLNIKKALEDKTLDIKRVDEAVLAVLNFVKRSGKFEDPEPKEERAVNDLAHQSLIRETAAEGMVLLKNDKNILPLKKKSLRSVAMIGLAKEFLAFGGGSAIVEPHYRVTPFDAITKELGDGVDVRFAKGAHAFRQLPAWSEGLSDLNNNPGFTLRRYYNNDFNSEPVVTTTYPVSKYLGIGHPGQAISLEAIYRPPASGRHYLSLSGMGLSRLFINGELKIDFVNEGDPFASLMGATDEAQTQYEFLQEQEYQIKIESLVPPGESFDNPLTQGMVGVNVGFMLQNEYEEDLIENAVKAATSADVALVFVGHTIEWESEGFDRTSMNLPRDGSQDRLIYAIAAVNPNVVVVSSTGAPFAMPWINSVSAVVQAWFPGQELGNSMADVLFGKVNPSGKLPVSFPKSLEDTPSYRNFPGNLETLQVDYTEDLHMGYRYYDKNPDKVLFPFGHGLSYTNFTLENAIVDPVRISPGCTLSVKVDVTNTGNLTGKEVIQVYLASPKEWDEYPLKKLVGFSKVNLDAGESTSATIDVAISSVAHWDIETNSWKVTGGQYELLVGNSSSSISKTAQIIVEETFYI